MNNFCRGSKYTETKINLERLHRCWREGDNSGVFSATTEKEAISSHGERLSEFI